MEKIPVIIRSKTLELIASPERKNEYFDYAKKIMPSFLSHYPVDALVSIYSLPLLSDDAIGINVLGYPMVKKIDWPLPITINQEPLTEEYFPVTILEGPCDPHIASSIFSLVWDFVFSVKFKIKPIEVTLPDRFVFDSIEMIYYKGVAERDPNCFKLLLRQIHCPEGWFTCTRCDELFPEKDRASNNDVLCPHCGHSMNPLFYERYYLKTIEQYSKFNPK